MKNMNKKNENKKENLNFHFLLYFYKNCLCFHSIIFL